jgi:hypothetical protein
MALPPARARLLAAMAAGHVLKVHRTLDGEKAYRLHWLEGDEMANGVEEVAAVDVESLLVRGLIVSNMKFPAATFLLTGAGLAAAQTGNSPTFVRGFESDSGVL